jgi:hypothetical protein
MSPRVTGKCMRAVAPRALFCFLLLSLAPVVRTLLAACNPCPGTAGLSAARARRALCTNKEISMEMRKSEISMVLTELKALWLHHGLAT